MSKRPNLLMIVCDQLRYDSLGFSGPNAVTGAPIRTPRLDALAAESQWFNDAYTALPTCCPARQCMLAGKRAETFGALWNYNITSKVASITPDQPTWPAAMRAAGYRMAYVGKWHVSPTFSPLDFGYESLCEDRAYNDWRKEHFPDADRSCDWFGGRDEAPTEATHTHWLAAKAIEKVREYAAGDAPWHVRLDFSEPHLPCVPCAEFEKLYDAKDLRPWPSFDDDFHNKPYVQGQMLYSWGNEDRTWDDWSRFSARYFAMIAQVDDAVGRVLDALRETGAYEDTVILFTADHGDMGGSHRMMDKHYVLYDDTVHVPLILRVPGTPPRRIDGFVNNCLDMAPTICETFGLRPFDWDGRSFAPALRGEEMTFADCAVSSTNGQQFGLYSQRMIRTKEYKYIWNLTDVDELYDLRADPWEMENRIADPALAPVLADLRRRLYDVLSREDPDIIRTEWPRRQLLEGRKKPC